MKLHHYGIYCTNLEESVEFYCTRLGFRQFASAHAQEGTIPLRMAWLVNPDGIKLELLERGDKSVTCPDGSTASHIAFSPDNLDEWLACSGLPVETGPFDAAIELNAPLDPEDAALFSQCGPGGLRTRLAFVRDPGGTRIELIDDNIAPL